MSCSSSDMDPDSVQSGSRVSVASSNQLEEVMGPLSPMETSVNSPLQIVPNKNVVKIAAGSPSLQRLHFCCVWWPSSAISISNAYISRAYTNWTNDNGIVCLNIDDYLFHTFIILAIKILYI